MSLENFVMIMLKHIRKNALCLPTDDASMTQSLTFRVWRHRVDAMPPHMAPTHNAHFTISPAKCLNFMQTYVGSSALAQLAEQPVPAGQNWALNVTVFLQPDTMSQVQSLQGLSGLCSPELVHTMRVFHRNDCLGIKH